MFVGKLSTVERQGQETQKFKAILGYTGSCLKHNKNLKWKAKEASRV